MWPNLRARINARDHLSGELFLAWQLTGVVPPAARGDRKVGDCPPSTPTCPAVGQANVPVQRRRGRCNWLLGVIVPLAPEYSMGGFLRRHELNAFVSQSAHVNPLEQSLSPTQQDRRDSNVQLINEARTKIDRKAHV